ncbi:lytic polysaccharide monooxygenase [Xylariaceae sp. FL1019]|nr:lytic polysaccharide monooxygenase [Xylariaceae sp. FL1019]
MYFANAAVAAAFVAVANAHMTMSSPSPFDPSALNNSPLAADGSDFPCKFGAAYTATGGTTNQYTLGSDQTLSFVGSAVHGGGSCQVVMTYDTNPTKDSKWKVIHSIEGGCPAKNTAGNLPQDDPNLEDPFTYPYTIPSDIPAGKGTIGFTWFNKVGNREMYMNCGALELTGDGGAQSNFDALPDMVVLNIGGAQTKEGFDYVYENPGNSVEVNIASTDQYVVCGADGCGDAQTGTPPSSGSGSSGSSSSAPVSSAAPTSTAAPASSPGGVFITVGSSSSAAPTSVAATSTPVAASPTSAPASTLSTAVSSSAAATPTPSSSTGSDSGSSSGAMTGACSTEGQWNCISGSSFQQCASGQWSAVMQMAAGTKCTAGQSTTMEIKAGKRSHARAFRA